LQPFETIYRWFVVNTPNDVNLLGTYVSMTASITMLTAEAEPSNDTYGIARPIGGSYDPNDKLVRTSSGTSDSYYYTDRDNFVDYTIRFQNTGTAEAINIFLLDTISDRFDLASFEFLGSSHPVEIGIEDDRVLRFDLPDIWLPDSTSDPLGSQGSVSFRLKLANVPVVGETLTNAADIYFDFNDPVRTNTAVLVVDVSSGIATERKGVALSVAPNPAHDRIRIIATDTQAGQVDVIDPAGRMVIGGVRYTAPLELDVATLAAGVYIVRLREGSGAAQQVRFVKH
ncbi:MAG: T9SS type A sorting domain-containing protein, partial [Flavobacteriales bacterium]|nr:T9SS type A sorting domain-containing protein [Flavobacteriales bacterium]